MTLPSLSRLGSLLMFVLAGRRAPVNALLMQRMLSGLVVVIGVAVVTAMFMALLVTLGLYAGYLALVANGLNENTALLVIGVLLAAIVCVLILVVQSQIRELKLLPAQFVQAEAPIAAGVSNVANAFVDGLMGKSNGNGIHTR